MIGSRDKKKVTMGPHTGGPEEFKYPTGWNYPTDKGSRKWPTGKRWHKGGEII